ncbi:MAG: nuclear transport factor 2 family protein [Cellvibrionaceae bacterium]|nr:nuclear transport factor 2 family protein [Cellvibrionaceae bacterium]
MELLQRFEHFYTDFKASDLARLEDLYSAGVRFRDPVQIVVGLDALQRYFLAAQQSVAECRFEFLDRVEQDNRCFYQWRMHYRHPRLAGGEPLSLRGMSRLQLSTTGRPCVEVHEDIYDMGAMLYEHVPVLRSGVRWLKGRLHG